MLCFETWLPEWMSQPTLLFQRHCRPRSFVSCDSNPPFQLQIRHSSIIFRHSLRLNYYLLIFCIVELHVPTQEEEKKLVTKQYCALRPFLATRPSFSQRLFGWKASPSWRKLERVRPDVVVLHALLIPTVYRQVAFTVLPWTREKIMRLRYNFRLSSGCNPFPMQEPPNSNFDFRWIIIIIIKHRRQEAFKVQEDAESIDLIGNIERRLLLGKPGSGIFILEMGLFIFWVWIGVLGPLLQRWWFRERPRHCLELVLAVHTIKFLLSGVQDISDDMEEALDGPRAFAVLIMIRMVRWITPTRSRHLDMEICIYIQGAVTAVAWRGPNPAACCCVLPSGLWKISCCER